MNKFLTNVGIFLISIIIIFIGLKFASNKYQLRNYDSAFIEKLDMLEKISDQPKIVLVGGSSTGFGLSAKMIADSLHLPCLNLGHNAELGLVHFQTQIQNCLLTDDIVIFSPEYVFFVNPYYYDPVYLYSLKVHNKKYYELCCLDDDVVAKYFSYFKLNFFQDISSQSKKGLYRSKCINEYGDVITNCYEDGIYKQTSNIVNLFEQKCSFNCISDTMMRCISYLNREKTYILFPPIPNYMYNNNCSILDSLNNFYYSLMPNQIVSPVKNNVYPDTLFLDFHYHLRCIGKEQRTKSLISILRKKIKALK